MTEPFCGFDLKNEIPFDNCFERPICGASVTNERFCWDMPLQAKPDELSDVPDQLDASEADFSVTRVAPQATLGLAPVTRATTVETVPTVVAATPEKPRPVVVEPSLTRVTPVRVEPVVVEQSITRTGPIRPASVVVEPSSTRAASVRVEPVEVEPSLTRVAPVRAASAEVQQSVTRTGPVRPVEAPSAAAALAPSATRAPNRLSERASFLSPVSRANTEAKPASADQQGQMATPVPKASSQAARPLAMRAVAEKHRQANLASVAEQSAPARPAALSADATEKVTESASSPQLAKPKWSLTGLEPVQDSILETDGEAWAWENGESCSIGR